MHGAAESSIALIAPLAELRLAATFRALQVRDPADGEQVLCYRNYLPA